jgi:hypothetical protein
MVDLAPLLGNSFYRDLDVDQTLDYMRRRYVEPLRKLLNIEQATLADCAAGYGWLSFAYLQAGGRHAILVDPDAERLKAAAAIAEMLGLAGRCEFVCAYLQDLKIAPVEVFASIETLEHVGRNNIQACIEVIASTALEAVVVTTPNNWFPSVAHDTGLPLAHWMPQTLRTWYAVAVGRGDRARNNVFLSPMDLRPLQEHGFQPASKYQTFATYAEFASFYPHYLPYGPNEKERFRKSPKAGLAAFVWLAGALAGKKSFTISPNLSSIWVREATSITGN